jgi:hypothetical protein
MEITMKPTLILSTLAVLSIVSSTSFAQNFVTYSSAFGNAHPTINTMAPVISRFTASDFGSQRVPQPQRVHSPGR